MVFLSLVEFGFTPTTSKRRSMTMDKSGSYTRVPWVEQHQYRRWRTHREKCEKLIEARFPKKNKKKEPPHYLDIRVCIQIVVSYRVTARLGVFYFLFLTKPKKKRTTFDGFSKYHRDDFHISFLFVFLSFNVQYLYYITRRFAIRNKKDWRVRRKKLYLKKKNYNNKL